MIILTRPIRYILILLFFFFRIKRFRSPLDIEKRYQICSNCPFFIMGKGWLNGYDKCELCGCNLHASDISIFNKLAIPTTKCPDTPPKWNV